MDSWLENLYSKNKALFWIFLVVGLPFIVLFLFRDLILKIIVQKSNEELLNSKVEDAKISEKESSAKKAALESKRNADDIESKIKLIEKDEDWNKKRKGEVSNLSFLFVIFIFGIIYCVSMAFLR